MFLLEESSSKEQRGDDAPAAAASPLGTAGCTHPLLLPAVPKRPQNPIPELCTMQKHTEAAGKAARRLPSARGTPGRRRRRLPSPARPRSPPTASPGPRGPAPPSPGRLYRARGGRGELR